MPSSGSPSKFEACQSASKPSKPSQPIQLSKPSLVRVTLVYWPGTGKRRITKTKTKDELELIRPRKTKTKDELELINSETTKTKDELIKHQLDPYARTTLCTDGAFSPTVSSKAKIRKLTL